MIKIKKTLLFTFIGLFLVLAAVFTILLQGASSPPPGRWQPVSLPPTYSLATGMTYTIPLAGVAYGNNTFVAVGDNGIILTSPDGTTWTSWSSGAYGNNFNGVAYGNNTFVAAGLFNTILTSPDGTNWTSRTLGTKNFLSGVACGNNTFVAVGMGGTILQSGSVGQLTKSNSTAETPRSTTLFSGVPSSYWAYNAVSNLVYGGCIAGYTDGAFMPDRAITRAEFVSVLAKALKLPDYNPSTSGFSDVSAGDWFYGSVESAVYAGLITGEGNGSFAPNKSLTREELAVILVSALGKENEASILLTLILYYHG